VDGRPGVSPLGGTPDSVLAGERASSPCDHPVLG